MSTVTLRIIGAREHEDDLADQLTQRVRDALVGLVAVAPDASFEIRLGSHAETGTGLIEVVIDAASAEATTLGRELGIELGRAYTVSTSRGKGVGALHAWALRPQSHQQPGFSVTGARMIGDASAGMREDSFATTFRTLTKRWLALAIEAPGLELVTRVSFDPTATAARAFLAGVGIEFSEPELPLRARALVQQLYPGWTVCEKDDAVQLSCSRAEFAVIAQLPVAGHEPLPGIPTSAPLPHPLQPSIERSEDGIRLGSAMLPTGVSVDVMMGEAEQRRHAHVIGNTGTGKSSTLAAFAHGYASNGNGFFCADVTGELIPRILAELPEEALERVWLIEAGDVENPVPLNAFAVDDDVEFDIIVQDLVLMFYKLFDPGHTGVVGPRFEGLLTNGLRGLRALRGTRASLLDVPRIYRDHRFESAVGKAVTDPLLQDFWLREMRDLNSNNRSEIIGWFASKFDRFSNTLAMRRILGTGADAFDPAQAMDDGRIILLDLSKRRLGEVAADLLGFLYITRLWSGFLSRKTNKTFGVIVDEAQSFSAGSLPSMLSEGRKWGASVVVAHQYLGQLDGPLLEALDGNVATKIAFRTGAHDAAEILRKIGGNLALSDLTTQPDLRAILSRTSGQASARPHTLMIDHGSHVARRSDAKLEKVTAQVRAQTHRALVDPYRHLTTFDVAELPRREAPRPASPAPRPPAPSAKPAEASFLDDWLARHQAKAGAVGQAVHSADDDEDEDEAAS